MFGGSPMSVAVPPMFEARIVVQPLTFAGMACAVFVGR